MKKLILHNGLLIDSHNQLHGDKKDIYVENGKIKKIADSIPLEGCDVIDAQGKYVSAGFIDIHVHNHLLPQPGRKTEPPSLPSIDELGVYRGVTTVVECGSYCIQDFAEFKVKSDEAKTRYFTFLSGHGEEGFGTRGSQDVRKIIPEHYYDLVAANPGYVVGIKVANSQSITNDKGYGLTKHAKEIAAHMGMPLMIHIGHFPPDPNGLIEFLDKGDIVTHAFHGKEISIFLRDGTPKDGFVRARERGVLFDVGHGNDSFNWTIYDKARRKGFLPDTISTDIRAKNIHGPVYSMATVMSKILNLGMSLEDVVNCSTFAPAKAIHKDGLGEIREGACGDFTIFDVDDVDIEIRDSDYNMQHLTKLIRPVKTIVSKHEESQVFDVIYGDPTKEYGNS
jgi:dihydroorotase